MKKLLIVANWKMNKTRAEAREFLNEFLEGISGSNEEIVIAPNFTLLDFVSGSLKNTKIKLAGQNMFFANIGAFTGEISANMLKDFDAQYVILGHSERRRYFLETDNLISKKVDGALDSGLKPIICVGETLEQYENGNGKELVTQQVRVALQNVKMEDIKKLVIAYEPIWAIGTGKSMSSGEANEMAKLIKDLVKKEFKRSVKVLYGGSMNENNFKEYFKHENIDGGLIGGASLDAKKFTKIILG
jgi:triosephosphate isomerase